LLCEASWIQSSLHSWHASIKYTKIAHVLAVELCLQCRLICAQMSIHLFSPGIHLSLDLSIVLFADTQNWHDYDPFQFPNSTAQYELIDLSHYHEICISRFLLLLVGWGARAACAELSSGSEEASKSNHMAPGI
jgi:hypothetical protein